MRLIIFPPQKLSTSFFYFLMLSVFYCQLICDYSKIARHLTQFLKKDGIIAWGSEQEHAFLSLKYALHSCFSKFFEAI